MPNRTLVRYGMGMGLATSTGVLQLDELLRHRDQACRRRGPVRGGVSDVVAFENGLGVDAAVYRSHHGGVTL